jgi:hypothetical protein
MSYDADDEERRRNRTIAIGVSVAAVTMVGLLFWLFNSLTGPALAVVPTTVTTSASTSATEVPSGSETSTAPPTIASWTPTTTFSLPPPEQPTETAPAGETANQPSPTQNAAPPPPGPGISNVNLTCTKGDGRRVTGRLTFTTTTKVDVILSAGCQIDRKSAGPGNVSMTTTGRGAEICFARIGDQTVGPIPAS